MDLVDGKEHPSMRLENVKCVLDFLTQTLSWGSSGSQFDLSDRAGMGLWIILTACIDTLKKLPDDAVR
jgi:hypothetical protein